MTSVARAHKVLICFGLCGILVCVRASDSFGMCWQRINYFVDQLNQYQGWTCSKITKESHPQYVAQVKSPTPDTTLPILPRRFLSLCARHALASCSLPIQASCSLASCSLPIASNLLFSSVMVVSLCSVKREREGTRGLGLGVPYLKQREGERYRTREAEEQD